MGMQMFTTSGTFNPTTHGLVAGDVLNIICVGGGGPGADVTGSGTSAAPYVMAYGTAGGASSFGSVVSAPGGSLANAAAQSGSMGSGGNSANSQNSNNVYVAAGGGAGGYEPGWPSFGGAGGNGAVNLQTDPVSSTKHYPSGLGGAGVPRSFASGSLDPLARFDGGPSWANMRVNTRGTRTAGSQTPASAAGNGFGAGGGAGFSSSYDNRYSSGINLSGGNAGSLAYATYALTSTATIAVTVGANGAGGNNARANGAPGVVIVFW